MGMWQPAIVDTAFSLATSVVHNKWVAAWTNRQASRKFFPIVRVQRLCSFSTSTAPCRRSGWKWMHACGLVLETRNLAEKTKRLSVIRLRHAEVHAASSPRGLLVCRAADDNASIRNSTMMREPVFLDQLLKQILPFPMERSNVAQAAGSCPDIRLIGGAD